MRRRMSRDVRWLALAQQGGQGQALMAGHGHGDRVERGQGPLEYRAG